MECDPNQEEHNALETKFLTFYTQNVWFEQPNIEERYNTIVQMAVDSDADFLCFQEVIGPFWTAITSNDVSIYLSQVIYFFFRKSEANTMYQEIT